MEFEYNYIKGELKLSIENPKRHEVMRFIDKMANERFFHEVRLEWLNVLIKTISQSTEMTTDEKIDVLDCIRHESNSNLYSLKTSTYNILLLGENGILPTELKPADYYTLMKLGLVYRDVEKMVLNVGGFDVQRNIDVLKITPYGIKRKKELLEIAERTANRQIRALELIGKV